MKKYFISCAVPGRKIGAIQIECNEDEYQGKSEELCPERCFFRAYEVEQFDSNMPVSEFVPFSKMKEIGY